MEEDSGLSSAIGQEVHNHCQGGENLTQYVNGLSEMGKAQTRRPRGRPVRERPQPLQTAA